MSDATERLNAALEGSKMNRCVLPLIIGSLLLPLGCGGPSSPPSPPGPSGNDNRTDPNAPLVLQPGELCSDHTGYVIATFEDADLEAAIRAALSVSAREDLTCGLVSGLTALAAPVSGGRGRQITVVSGALRVPAPVDPFESLAGIQNLTSLTRLDLFNKSITDISALRGLTSLTFLFLPFNQITDIGALSGLTSLTSLHLDGNLNLSNIQPLLANTGLGAGDSVILANTNVSCTDVVALAAKGVTVTSACP